MNVQFAIERSSIERFRMYLEIMQAQVNNMLTTNNENSIEDFDYKDILGMIITNNDLGYELEILRRKIRGF